MSTTTPRVLSIQSHVVHGFVGNRSATFPLQLLGADVDFVNSVQFSNHTGYSHGFRGTVLDGPSLLELIDGLEDNGLLQGYTHLLTGYIGSESFLEAVATVVARLRKVNPGLIYVCDPVLGDDGKMYVPEHLINVYREVIIPLADVVTPNSYEVGLLVRGKESHDMTAEEALASAKWFHERGVNTVIQTSLGQALLDTDKDAEGEMLTLVLSSVAAGNESVRNCTTNDTDHESDDDQNDSHNRKRGEEVTRAFSVDFPKLKGNFTGTGDLTAALWLAWSWEHPLNLERAAVKVIATMNAVIKRTIESPGNGELKIVQSKRDIENPDESSFKAVNLLKK